MSHPSGGNFNPDRVGQLSTRLAALLGIDPEAELEARLEELDRAIGQGESNISTGQKILTWMKSLFSGDSYKAAIATQAFSKITDQYIKGVLVTLALQAAVLPEKQDDVKDNVQTVLKFCQAADVVVDEITEAIETIPDFEEKKDQIVAGLNLGGPKGVACLVLLHGNDKLPNLPEFAAGKITQVVIELAKVKTDGAECVSTLLDDHMGQLPTLSATEAKQVAINLAKRSDKGRECLVRLFQNGKMQNLELKDVDPAEVKTRALKLLDEGFPDIDGFLELLGQRRTPPPVEISLHDPLEYGRDDFWD
jgi:hypothetical protein